MTREEQLERLNAIRIFRDLVQYGVRTTGLHPKDAIKHSNVSLDGLPKDKRPSSFYTLQNDLSCYLRYIRGARAALRPDACIDIKEKHMALSANKAFSVFKGRYKKRTENAKALPTNVFDRALAANALSETVVLEMEDTGVDYTQVWRQSEHRQLIVPLTHGKHMLEMGLDDWVKVGGRAMMFIKCIERKRPAWAEEAGIQVRKAVMMEPASYSLVPNVFRYHNNVWLLTMKTHDGSVITAANKNWDRARSLMNQYIKTSVIDQLDGL